MVFVGDGEGDDSDHADSGDGERWAARNSWGRGSAANWTLLVFPSAEGGRGYPSADRGRLGPASGPAPEDVEGDGDGEWEGESGGEMDPGLSDMDAAAGNGKVEGSEDFGAAEEEEDEDGAEERSKSRGVWSSSTEGEMGEPGAVKSSN